MAHEIKELDHVMLGSRVPAWHGLGTVVEGQPTTAEALRQSRLDWTVETEPAFMEYPSPDNPGERCFSAVDAARLIVRNDLPRHDLRQVLGHCGKGYIPIQNTEAFAIGDALIDQGGMRWETAGSLRNGQLTFMLGAMPNELQIKDDVIKTYLLITNPHTGARSLDIQYTGIRVVCSNTYHAAIGEKKQARARILHTGSTRDQIKEAKRILRLGDTVWERNVRTLTQLADAKIDARFLEAYLAALYPIAPDAGPIATRNTEGIHAAIRRLYDGEAAGSGQIAARGTAYGLFNATTEYLNRREARVPKRLNKAERRFDRIMYGHDAETERVAMGLLCRQTGIDEPYVSLTEMADAN